MNAIRRDFFVTGTDTGVGKTLVSTALLRGLRRRGASVAGMKPVASGSVRTPAGLRNDDALALAAEASRPWPYETVNPYCFEPAIAPHLAAAAAGVGIALPPLVRAFRQLQAGSDTVVVEGAGGFLVPLGASLSLADLPGALGLEIILVVGLRLGCLNHALLSVEAIGSRGLRVAGWVGNSIDPGFARPEQNLATLRERIAAPCLGVIPALPRPDPGAAMNALTALDLLAPPPAA
jgi:dethiobiotin synthetase